MQETKESTPNGIPLMFLRFILTQLTLFIAFEEFNRIFKYSNMEFNYHPMGPHLLKSSKVPPNNVCYQFYDQNIPFVQSGG